MAREVKIVAARPSDLCSVPGTYVAEKGNRLPQVLSLPPKHVHLLHRINVTHNLDIHRQWMGELQVKGGQRPRKWEELRCI